MPRLAVDRSLCQGHARCHSVNEDLFDIDDLGYVQIKDEELRSEDLDDARKGMVACPERALSLHE